MSPTTTYPPRRPAAAAATARRWTAPEKATLFWVMGFLVVQMFCQLGLLFEILAPFRVAFRVGAYTTTLAAFVFALNTANRPKHPAFWAGVAVLLILALELLNPTTNTVTAALAQIALNLAIITPLFWVPRLHVTVRIIRTAIIFMWLFHTLSAFFGVLQVYFPGQYQPAVSQAIKDAQHGGEHLKLTLTSGDYIYRPMGLTDIPGGAATAGMYAFIFGVGMLSITRSGTGAVLSLISMPVGMFCIYLSQVRSVLVLVVIVTVCYCLLLAATRNFGAAVRVAFVVPAVAAGAFLWAVLMGGDSTRDRFATLLEDNPAEVYSKNRGQFLNETFDSILPEHPFGAGLGRWGMMNTYFGDPTVPDSGPIWVEIQWTAWVIDGGVLLLAGYIILLWIAVGTTARIGFSSPNPELAAWAKLVLGYDIAMVFLTFSYVPFLSQSGIEFWLLNAMLFAADRADRRARRPAWRTG